MVGYDSEPLFNMGALMAVLPLLLLIVAAVVGGRWVGRNAAGARRIAFWGVPGACAAYVELNVLLVMLLVGRYSSASAILMQEAGLSLMFSVLVPYLPPVVLAVACALRPGKVSYRVALVWDALTLGTMVLRDVNLYPSLGYAISLGSFEILLSTACLVGVLFFAALLGMLIWFNTGGMADVWHLTVFFTVFVMLQWWNLFNAKALGSNHSAFHGFFADKGLMLVLFIILAGQIVIVTLGGKMFRVEPLSVETWLWIIVCTSPVMIVGELIRAVSRLKNR